MEPSGRGGRDEGFTVAEIAVAMLVLAVGVVAVLSMFMSASHNVGVGKDRNLAISLVGSYLEEVRSQPYANVLMRCRPSRNADPAHPDHGVSQDGQTYRYDTGRPPETLAVAANPLAVPCLQLVGLTANPQPFPPGPIRGEVYQYVTWVDDPAMPGTSDYKRVTVVARWTGGPSTHNRQVRMSTLVTP